MKEAQLAGQHPGSGLTLGRLGPDLVLNRHAISLLSQSMWFMFPAHGHRLECSNRKTQSAGAQHPLLQTSL